MIDKTGTFVAQSRGDEFFIDNMLCPHIAIHGWKPIRVEQIDVTKPGITVDLFCTTCGFKVSIIICNVGPEGT